MSELIVVAYDTPAKAEAARYELFGMAKEYLVEIADAVIATADKDRNIKLDQMVNMWTLVQPVVRFGAFWRVLSSSIPYWAWPLGPEQVQFQAVFPTTG
ncbi:DUF1269 domain-containing protein [Pseudophaeobacter arcticus]|jgi:uncharacterized membrane protein|uniref:DUF1269 domain-containing protein n=1 Tax=Pseudophaeobacter arcticus TaxID=385492 RepID=UPI0039E720CC